MVITALPKPRTLVLWMNLPAIGYAIRRWQAGAKQGCALRIASNGKLPRKLMAKRLKACQRKPWAFSPGKLIVGILLLGLLLRLVNLNQSLWLDEAVQAITAQNNLSYILLEIRGDFHPPLFYFLMHFWVRIFGSSEIALRMPSVLFGVGTVYLVYRINKLFVNGLTNFKIGPLVAALFLATAPFHIYYSQEARMYAAVTFFTVGSFYYFLRVLDDDRGYLKDGEGIGYLIFTLLAVYTDYYAFLILPVQWLFLIYKKKKLLLLASVFSLVFYLPWLPMFITQLKTGSLATQTLPAWGKLVNLSFSKAIPLTFIKFGLGRIVIFDKNLYAAVSLFVLIGLGSLIIVGLRKLRKKDVAWLIVLGWLSGPIFIAWIFSLVIPNYQPFRLLLTLPAFYLLVARGISVIKSARVRALSIVLVLILNFSSLSAYFCNPFFQREDWQGLSSFLKNQSGASVILPSSNSDWAIKYYDQRNEIKLLFAGRRLGEIKDTLEISQNLQAGKVFFIRYLVPLYDPQELILEEISQSGYTKAREISFNQIPVWEYQRIINY